MEKHENALVIVAPGVKAAPPIEETT